jgi:predicted DNA-binding transcriptional regulator AlpA
MKKNRSKEFYTREEFAQALGCSLRHFDNLNRQGRVPEPVSLGRLKRWPNQVIQKWIDDGCPERRERGGK